MTIKTRLLSLVTTSLVLLSHFAMASAAPFNPTQTKAIESIVHHYLMEHPDILVAMTKKLQQQQIQSSVDSTSDVLFNSPESPIIGKPTAPISVVEFFDYQCPHCKTMGPVLDAIHQANPDVRIIFKEFPIFGKTSIEASKAALAAKRQGKYMTMHNALMKSKGRLNNEKIINIAKSVGLDIEKLKKDMQDPAIDEEIKSTFMASQSLGISGTPAFMIGAYPNTKQAGYDLISGATNTKRLNLAIGKVRDELKQ